MSETVQEEIARLQNEIAERQYRLNFLALGDQRVRVSTRAVGAVAGIEDRLRSFEDANFTVLWRKSRKVPGEV